MAVPGFSRASICGSSCSLATLFGLRDGAGLVREHAERDASRTPSSPTACASAMPPFLQAIEQTAFAGFGGRALEIHPVAVEHAGFDLARHRRITAVAQRLARARGELVGGERADGDAAAIASRHRLGLARQLQPRRVHLGGHGQRGFLGRKPLRPREEREVDQQEKE